jgi:hypothetical protein
MILFMGLCRLKDRQRLHDLSGEITPKQKGRAAARPFFDLI